MDQKIEDHLLLYCLNTGTGEKEASRLETLSPVEWDDIIQLSIEHRVTPLLYHRFKTKNVNNHVPIRVMHRLQEAYLRSAWENTRLYYELSKVLKALQDGGISVIVLKGAALAELIFQNIALRPMSDIDLLVKGKDIWKIGKVLSGLGYDSNKTFTVFWLLPRRTVDSVRLKRLILLLRRYEPWIQRSLQTFLKGVQRIQYAHRALHYWIKHIEYSNPVISLELHPKIYELPKLNPWPRVASAAIASTDTFRLESEDLLLHTCLHANHHLLAGSARLIWWCDIVEILRYYKQNLNWDYVIQVAKKHRVEEAMHRILNSINEWFGWYVPADVLSQLSKHNIPIPLNEMIHSYRVSTDSVKY
jgi:hypothetical protein